VLEVIHPVSSGGDVASAGALWVPLHVALIVGYVLLVWLLWQVARAALPRIASVIFVLANTAFLVVDGILGRPGDAVLANLTGATWCLLLLALAASWYRPDRPVIVMFALTWLAFVAGVLQVSPLLSRVVAIATAAWLAYRSGVAGVPSALLAFASVLRQHVGPEAALGLLCVAAALGLQSRIKP
jgi:hypothetical protein